MVTSGPKVLAICGESPDHVYGGMGVHCVNLYGAMTGADVTWLTVADNYDPTGKPYAVTHATSPWYGSPKRGRERFQEHCRGMLVEALRHEFDVIHAHDWSAVQVAVDLRQVTGCPVVTTFHLFQHQVAQVEQYKTTPMTLLSIEMEAVGICESDAVIVCSRQMRKYIASDFGYQTVIAHVIPNAVNCSEFGMPAADFPCTKPVVLYCGRLSDQKGVRHILDAVECTDAYMFVLLAGFPTDEPNPKHHLDTRIRELVKRYPDRIKWVQHIEGPERFAWHKRADVGIMPSLCEPFGIAALEFFAAMCPLVTTGVDGMKDFVDDSNAVIIDSPNTGDLIGGIERALIERDSMVDHAYDTADRNSWAGVANQTLDVYNSVLNGRDVREVIHAD